MHTSTHTNILLQSAEASSRQIQVEAIAFWDVTKWVVQAKDKTSYHHYYLLDC
jgi:hypothetical protein